MKLRQDFGRVLIYSCNHPNHFSGVSPIPYMEKLTQDGYRPPPLAGNTFHLPIWYGVVSATGWLINNAEKDKNHAEQKLEVPKCKRKNEEQRSK